MTGNSGYHVGHFNMATLIADWDDPAVAEFLDNIDRVNAIAERSPGFVWRYDEDRDGLPDHPVSDDPRVAWTLSAWESADALDDFVSRTVHGSFLRRRDSWFTGAPRPNYVVWPIPKGHRPTIKEALERLSMLGENGPSSTAYDLYWHRAQAGRKEAAHA